MNSENKRIIIASFTKNGIELAKKISSFLDTKVFVPERFVDETLEKIDASLTEWAGKIFSISSAIIFVSACGIAVRAIAPHIKSKLVDPAVIVIDEKANFVIPILSGHIGGANELAKKIAGYLHAIPVITTATDVNNLIAIDEWAVKNNCVIENPSVVKNFSSAVLESKNVGVAITHELHSAPFNTTLWLRPKNLILGVGCNRGIDENEFEEAAQNFLQSSGVSILSLKALASIDLKSNENALILFAKNHGIDFITFSADELRATEGNFTRSQKVFSVTGVDNVCERACVLAAGENAVLMRSKTIYNSNITLALARTND
ncbi:MAG: cobalt-precorrin 5A hydrolase [Synergistaceae bacterium]|nr:cobalt-precorrin 5A hydrolase [Synergistaceae bacterium]